MYRYKTITDMLFNQMINYGFFFCPLPSNNWTVNDLLVEFREFFPDDWDGIGQSVEGNLREEVVFGLELHAAHQDHPKEVCVFVVSAGDHLVLDE
jgi:hypothetical protein